MRNAWRLVVFDVLAPLATIAALAAIGVLLGWPLCVGFDVLGVGAAGGRRCGNQLLAVAS